MRTQTRPGYLVAAAALIFGAMSAIDAAPATAANAGVPPFCIMRGGPRGPGSVPQLCRWYDYQSCLQAAADLNGNCVINIDYKGKVSFDPPPRPARRAR
jgi:hypothetical protein